MLIGAGASRAAWSAPVIAIAAAGLLTVCGAPRYHYLSNTKDQTFLRVPNQWKVFDEDQIIDNTGDSDEAKAAFKQLSWTVGFDASPRPSVKNVLSAASHPTGLAQVRVLTPEERDTFSQSSLRSLLLPFDPLAPDAGQAGDVEVLGSREVDQGGLHGSEFLLNLRTKEGEMIKWRQIALVDSRVSRAHVLAITCNAECYESNEAVIEKVVRSWKVKER